jgi:hypothetical protein
MAKISSQRGAREGAVLPLSLLVGMPNVKDGMYKTGTLAHELQDTEAMG